MPSESDDRDGGAPPDNEAIADVFEQTASLLELEGASPFRIMAWRNAAWTIRDHTTPLSEMVRAHEKLTDLPSIGKDTAAAIVELVQEGKSTYFDEVAQRVPSSLLEVIGLPGLGPKKAARLWKELGVVDLATLEENARAGKIAELKGFGAKTEQTFLKRIEARRNRS